ncbi:MAG: MFS transporter [Myxococcales bacterium]
MSSPSSPRVSRAARLALWVSLWGIFVSNITLTILTLALPYIARDLQAEPAATNWVTLGPMLVVALFTPAAGRASDVLGRKRAWVGGFGISLLGMAASAFAPSLGPLLLARVVTAVGTALLVPAALAISTDLFPPEERATPIGYWTSAVAISPLVGVLIGGSLLDVISWRWLFAGQVLLGLPALAAAMWGFEEKKIPTEGPFDVRGSIAIGAAALSLTLAASWLGHPERRTTWVPAALTAALVAGLWAVRIERRAALPVLPPHLLQQPVVSLSLLARVALTFSYMGAFMILPYLFKELWHLSALASSLLLVWRPLAMGLTGPFAGNLAPRFGAARLVVWGGYCILIASAGFVWLDAHPNQVLVVLGLALAGVGLGLCAPGSVSVVTERVGSELLGTVSAIMTLTANLANALGMAVMFAVVEASGGVASASAYRVSFGVGTAVAAFGVWLSHELLKRAPGREHAGGETTREADGTLDAP